MEEEEAGTDVMLGEELTPENSSDDSDTSDSADDSDVEESVPQVPEPEEVDPVPEPFDYSGHLQRIKVLREKGDLKKVREAREFMNKSFPLSPQLWLDWIEDERKGELCSTAGGREAIIALFERAVHDYLSVDIWVEYVHFTIGYMSEPDGSIEKVRSVLDKALMAAGLHVPKGALLWECYREFELIILSNLVPNCPGENADLAEQLKRVANLFKRQLSVPLFGMEKTYASFEEWLEQYKTNWTSASSKSESALVDRSNVDIAYKKALERLHQIQPFEDILSTCEESQKATHYKEYLKFEQSFGEPVRLLCLFERAVSDCPLDPPLWLGYIEFSNEIHAGEKTLLVCQRSVRNCPWYSLLWQQFIRCMEKSSKPHIEVKAVLEEALRSGMQTAEDYRNLWIEYCSYFRRRIHWGTVEEGPLLLEFRETIQTACEHLDQYFGGEGDPSCQLLRFMATVDAVQSRQIDEARKTWNDILYKGHKTAAASWLQYIHLEMAYGDSKHLRKLFPRALQSTRDWPESIVEEWLNFERVEGTLDSYEDALFKCRSRMKQVKEEREKAAAEESLQQQPAGSSQTKAGQGRRLKEKQQKDDKSLEDRRTSSLKRPLSRDIDVKSKPSYEGVNVENNTLKRPKLDTPSECGFVVEHDPSKDNRTVFVSNLDFSTDSDKVRALFAPVGTITELRLVKDFKGRSKGFCYVVFSSFEEMNEALKKDRELIDGRPVFVSKCDPDKHTRQHGFKYNTTLEKNKLFVKGLPLSTTKEDLENLFGQFGRVKSIRPVTYRNGHFKGIAYVDFEDEVSAAKAIIKVDGTTIGNKVVSVALSNPPDRRTSLIAENNEPSTSFSNIQSLGGGLKETGARGRGRTQISFVPRSVQVKPEDANADLKTSTSTNGAPKAKNNADFRKMLLGEK